METLTLLRLLAAYVLLTTLARLTGSGMLGAIVNLFGVAMPLMMFAYFNLRGIRVHVPRGLLVGYGMLAAALVVSVLLVGLNNVADLTKFLLTPLFAILGYNSTAFDRDDERSLNQLRIVGFILLLPVAYALVLMPSSGAGDALGIFVNRNNAALYLVVLSNLLFVMGASVGVVVATLTVGAMLFSTIGVLIAVTVALLVSLSLRRYLPAYLGAAALGAFLVLGPIQIPMGERLEVLGEGIEAVTALGLWTKLSELSYAELYVITGENSDLSLFFRLKHWADLLLVWTSEDWVSLLFGLGIGSSPLHTDLGLVPHNDYLRFLIESGPLGFLGFASITGWLLWSIGRNALLMSTAAVAIYFFTENLVDNFASMTLYYWFAGYWARYASGGEPAEERADEPNLVTEGHSTDMAEAPAGLSEFR